MAAHQICEMEQSQEIKNELVDVIMLICHITTAANLDFIMMHCPGFNGQPSPNHDMHIYLQESIYKKLPIDLFGFAGIFMDRLNYPTLRDTWPSSQPPNLYKINRELSETAII